MIFGRKPKIELKPGLHNLSIDEIQILPADAALFDASNEDVEEMAMALSRGQLTPVLVRLVVPGEYAFGKRKKHGQLILVNGRLRLEGMKILRTWARKGTTLDGRQLDRGAGELIIANVRELSDDEHLALQIAEESILPPLAETGRIEFGKLVGSAARVVREYRSRVRKGKKIDIAKLVDSLDNIGWVIGNLNDTIEALVELRDALEGEQRLALDEMISDLKQAA